MTQDLDLALRLADAADAITTAAFRRADLVVETKADRTPVSEADRGVERALRVELAADRPGDRIIGEEYGDTADDHDAGAGDPGTGDPGPGDPGPGDPGPGDRGPGDLGSGRVWIIDPIDGTKNFVRRNPSWATLLALQVDGQGVVGVVSAPALGRRWYAARGEGAFVVDLGRGGGEPVRMHVSKVAQLADAHMSGTALSSWKRPDTYLDLALRCYADRSFGDFWSHMLVAEGAYDIGLDPIASLWDLAALQVIVEEAGGNFTDFSGVGRPDGGSAVSTNGILHGEVLAALGAEERG